MFKAVIAGYSRSPFTMARKGELIDVKPVNLLAEVVNNLVSKTKINKEDIEDIVVGCAFQTGEQCFNIGKLVTFLAMLLRSPQEELINHPPLFNLKLSHHTSGKAGGLYCEPLKAVIKA